MDKSKFPFIANENEIATSILSFNASPELHEEILNNNPKYFPFVRQDDKIYFALSKFATFKNVTPEDYILDHRYQTNGHITRKEIEKVTGRKFAPVEDFDFDIQNNFTGWITSISEKYRTHNFFLLEINPSIHIKYEKKISPEELAKMLLKQCEVGKVGEEIALKYETDRLIKEGCTINKQILVHTSKVNAAAGYDIYSNYKHERFIEVKSSTKDGNNFFITENELAVLKAKGDRAYLYKVLITDLGKKKGEVVQVINNPYEWIEKEMKLTSKLYQVSSL